MQGQEAAEFPFAHQPSPHALLAPTPQQPQVDPSFILTSRGTPRAFGPAVSPGGGRPASPTVLPFPSPAHCQLTPQGSGGHSRLSARCCCHDWFRERSKVCRARLARRQRRAPPHLSLCPQSRLGSTQGQPRGLGECRRLLQLRRATLWTRSSPPTTSLAMRRCLPMLSMCFRPQRPLLPCRSERAFSTNPSACGWTHKQLRTRRVSSPWTFSPTLGWTIATSNMPDFSSFGVSPSRATLRRRTFGSATDWPLGWSTLTSTATSPRILLALGLLHLGALDAGGLQAR